MRTALLLTSLCTTLVSAWVTLPPTTSTRTPVFDRAGLFSAEVDEDLVAPAIDEEVKSLNREYEAAKQQAEALLKAAVDNDGLLNALVYFIGEYMQANQDCFLKTGDERASPKATVERFMESIQLGMQFGMGPDKYAFGPSHVALRGNPETEDGNEFDYYEFGNNFFRTCMDDAVVEGQEHLDKAMEQIAAGENVVFFANHQSEADPQVVSICLEKAGYAQEAADMVYVAGHKVTTDPLAIPFSMGRNMICIHSKKHIDADKTTKPIKQRQNLAAMNALLEALKKGGTSVWVAPSGGRDRRNVETGEIPIAPFDSKTIDMFRLMGTKSKVKTHYYPMAMVSYELCPPPDYVVAGVGEERNVRFVPVGITVGPEVHGGKNELCSNAFEQCNADYKKLRTSIFGADGTTPEE